MGRYAGTMTHDLPAAVLLDHDGTLVDTEPLWGQAKEELAAEFGQSWTEQDTLDCLGQPMAMTLDRLAEIGVDLPREQMLDRLVQDAERIVARAEIDFLPGIPALLEELAAAGIPAAIVTNATSGIARLTAGRAPQGLVRTVVGDEHVQRPKPDPQPYLIAAEQLGVDPAQCVAVEDSPSGTQAAVAAGCKVVVVPGMQPVDPAAGDAHLNHQNVTLDVLRGLFRSVR